MHGANAGLAGSAAPGSAQDFVVNVGDRVFFESDSSELTPQSIATLDKQAQWLGRYNRYAFTVGAMRTSAARANTTSRSARGARRRCATISTSRGVEAQPHAHDLLRQGAPGRGVQRHLVLVAEPPLGDGAQRELLSRDGLPGIRTGALAAPVFVGASDACWNAPAGATYPFVV